MQTETQTTPTPTIAPVTPAPVKKAPAHHAKHKAKHKARKKASKHKAKKHHAAQKKATAPKSSPSASPEVISPAPQRVAAVGVNAALPTPHVSGSHSSTLGILAALALLLLAGGSALFLRAVMQSTRPRRGY